MRRLNGALLLLAWLAAGCARMPSISVPNPLNLVAGPSAIHVEVPTKQGASPVPRGGQTMRLAVADFTDARPGGPGRKVGDIKATVSNLHATELTLDQDVAALLGNAVRRQLVADGFRLVNAGEPADFKLGATTKVFSLNIAGTDELAISVEATLREGRNGDVVWAGVVSERSDRYAGVSGNSRASIVEYLGDGIAAFSGKLSAAVQDSLARHHPPAKTVSRHETNSTIPGASTTMSATAARATPPAAEMPAGGSSPARAVREAPAIPAITTKTSSAPAPAVASAPAPVAHSGFISVSSAPSRAKVYIEDVYHGMTPLKLELPVGVVPMRFKLDGYKSASEKVAVRRGETTELEIKLQR